MLLYAAGAETATPKWGGLMRGKARQRAIARCDQEGSGWGHAPPKIFFGVFWVSEIDSDAISGI